ncbi:MAG: SDR family oxidoreductase [Candidatus Kapaibacterium sp.]
MSRTVWITGASRGIGKALADILLEKGYKLALSARSEESFSNSGFRNGGNVIILPCDISVKKEVESAYTGIKEKFGTPDILVNNAGIGIFAPFTELSEDEFDKMISINFKGCFLCSKAVINDMLKRKSGAVINVLSGAAIKGFPNSSVYGATKAAVLGMSRALREEVRDSGVKICDILPGATETEMWPDEPRRQFSERMMKPEDAAQAISSLIELSANPRAMPEELLLKPQWGDL